LNKDIIEEFYLLALMDISNGRSITELEEAINLYEEAEEYEACAGILKAVHESGFMTIKEIINKLDDDKHTKNS
jgi:exonuclease VII small subunit